MNVFFKEVGIKLEKSMVLLTSVAMIGVMLAGCGSNDLTPTQMIPSQNQMDTTIQSPSKQSSQNQADTKNQPQVGQGSQNQPTTLPTTIQGSSTATASNITVSEVASADKVNVGNTSVTYQEFIHGTLEPVIFTITITPDSTPIEIDASKFSTVNTASNIGGGMMYYKLNGQIYKVWTDNKGEFAVQSQFTIEKPTTITFIGGVGTPTPPGQKIELKYKSQSIGKFDVTLLPGYSLP